MAKGWWTSTSGWLPFSRIREAETDEGLLCLSKGGALGVLGIKEKALLFVIDCIFVCFAHSFALCSFFCTCILVGVLIVSCFLYSP